MRYVEEKKLNIWIVMALGILALFPLFVVYPLILALYKSVLIEEGKPSFSYFTRFSVREYYWSTLVNSLKVTIVSTPVAAFLGLIMVYVLQSIEIRDSKYLNTLIVISYLSLSFTGTYVWTQLLGRGGFIAKIPNSLFQVKPGGIYGFTDIMLVFSFQSFPLVYIYTSGVLKSLDNSLNKAMGNLGCTAFQCAIQVTIPLVVPTMLASSLLVLMRVFSDFGAPMLIGEGYKTFPVLVHSQFMDEVSTDDHFATALRVIAIIITPVLFFFQRYLRNQFTYSMTALKPMEAEYCMGIRNILPCLFVYTVVSVAILPQSIVIFISFLAADEDTIYTGGSSLENCRNTLLPKSSNGAIFNIYLSGLCAIATVVVLGIFISYLTVRKKSLLIGILGTATMFLYIIPGSVLSISFLYALSNKPMLLSGTAIIIIISLSVRRMPYTIRSSTTTIGQISPNVEEAIISLGCTEAKSSVKITVSMMMSGVPSSTITSWITLISRLSSSIILYTSKAQTLAVAIYAEAIRSSLDSAVAYSTILTLTSIISLLVFLKVMRSNDISMRNQHIEGPLSRIGTEIMV